MGLRGTRLDATVVEEEGRDAVHEADHPLEVFEGQGVRLGVGDVRDEEHL